MNISSQYSSNTVSSTSNKKSFEEQSMLGKDDFLKIFVTQLQNQDPLEPLQDREFIAQMAQFSSLEQLTNISKTNEAMVYMQENLINEIKGLNHSILQEQNSFAQYADWIGRIAYWLNSDQQESNGIIESIIRKDNNYFALINGHETPVQEIFKIE